MKAVVLYQSRSGNTRRAGELIGQACLDLGIDTGMWPVTNPDHHALAEADVVFVGTWVGGIIVAGHHPGDTGKLAQLPSLFDKDVGAFMTYEIHAGKVLDKFAGWLHRHKGAEVHATSLIKRRELDTLGPRWAETFVAETLASIGVQIDG